MKHGLSESTVERIQSVLAHFPDVEKAVLYGSRAMGTHCRG
jgi:predicted nucleotidyltransferase